MEGCGNRVSCIFINVGSSKQKPFLKKKFGNHSIDTRQGNYKFCL